MTTLPMSDKRTTTNSCGDTPINKDEAYFSNLLKETRSDLQEKLPQFQQDPSIFVEACRSVQDARAVLDAATAARDRSSSTDNNADKEQAQRVVEAAERALAAASHVALLSATVLLSPLLPQLENNHLDDALTRCAVLVEATPKQLAEYCARGPAQDDLVEQLLLKDDGSTIRKEFLQAGGAKQGRYGEAMELYTRLLSSIQQQDNEKEDTPSSSSSTALLLYKKLAVGVSVELADGALKEFDNTDVVVDPVERFRHYVEAHENQELDDADFASSFSSFELRHVINSNAPNAQLAWGRRMLRNYRPDQIVTDNRQWRYVLSVRTDVPYKVPTWTGTPHTYPMILSGGGQCGPRAWFGRFILQAFGIPVWGCRQPGHAALTHWTPDGWVVCLGATWKFCTWEGRWGPDFLLETQARRNAGEEEKEYTTVLRLEWIANVLGEPPLDPSKCLVHPDSLWRSLALMQKTILSKKQAPPRASTGHHEAMSRNSSSSIPRTIPRQESIVAAVPSDQTTQGAVMVVPAASCCKPTSSTKNVIFMQSYLGGLQIHHLGDEVVEYCLNIPEDDVTYSVTVLVVTVHRDCEKTPLLLTVDHDEMTSVAVIPIPYTMGTWQETQPVTIELFQGTNVMRFTRETPNYGVTLKSFLFRNPT